MDNDVAGQPDGLTAAGTVIADRYRLVDRIAGGGMGYVWRAVDEVPGRTVALKLLRPELADDEEFRERLRREARAASAISDAGVVPVFDFGEVKRDNAPPLSYLVMEYIDGVALSAEVAATGPLGAERTILILEQAASALQAAHDAGVIHRDIKPGNIMVTPRGDLKITDFGIARAADAVPLTRTGMITGTAKYFSPEQARGEPATAASDLYSLGVVAYACLAGAVPFNDGNDISVALAHVEAQPPELPADVPAGLRDLIMRMLEKKPSDRPGSARAVAAAARALRTDEAKTLDGQHPFPPAPAANDSEPGAMSTGTVVVPAVDTTAPETEGAPPREHASPRRRRRRWWTIAPLLVLAVAAAIFFWQSGGTPVPNVVGKQRDEAQTILTNAGLHAKFTTTDVPGKKEGIVVKQSEDPTSEADKGSTITLTVASGRVDLPTDELLGASYAEAAATLKGLGLKAGKRTTFSTDGPGTVIAVRPERRARVGSTVTLTVVAKSLPNDTGQNDNTPGPTNSPGPTKKPSPSPTPEPSPTPKPKPKPTPTEPSESENPGPSTSSDDG